MSKRRFIDLLPARLRTEDLKNFFGATVDHLFQPGSAEQISGYIGEHPSYTNDEKDFYINEPTFERQNRQLEPVMVQKTATAVERVLFYSDLVGHLRSNGGLVDFESRLFENDYYAWAPPVDIDKLNNFQNYFWFNDMSQLPALVLSPPSIKHVADGIENSFALPPVVIAMQASKEFPVVFLDGVELSSSEFSRVGDDLVLVNIPALDTIVEVIRYGDLKLLIDGEVQFNPMPFLDIEVTKGIAGIDVDHAIPPIPALTTGMRVILYDGLRRGFDIAFWDTVPWDDAINSFLVDGVGSSIRLTDHSRSPTRMLSHFVMDRRAINSNPWSRANHWVHRLAFKWSGLLFPENRASRPILDFAPEMELYNYGSRTLGEITCVLTGTPQSAEGWDITEYDTTMLDNIYNIDVAEINGRPSGSVLVDNGYALNIGDRLLIARDVPSRPEVSQTIVNVIAALDSDDNEVMALVPEEPSVDGDTVNMFGLESGYFFNGLIWKETQTYVEGEPPLFNLYDIDGIALDDPGIYPESDFVGSRIFGLALGTGDFDAVLGVPLKYDAYGQIVFENDLATRRATYEGGEIEGFYFYKTFGQGEADKFENDWHLAEETSFHSGDSFGLPKNLTANANNEQVSFISRNEWFDHFASILINQDGFEGEPYADNNWRDGPRNLSRGQRILQHRSPLLKLMLIASDKSFDYMDASRFTDQEYSRFRGRFAQKAVEFLLDGKLDAATTADHWALSILTDLKSSKTIEFPFAFNTIGGGQYFIPPTPSALGLMPCTPPELVVDTYYNPPVTFLKGHDGSMMPMFGERKIVEYVSGPAVVVLGTEPLGGLTVKVNGVQTSAYTLGGRVIELTTPPATGSEIEVIVTDVRDIVMLALEQRIYANIPDVFKGEEPLGFELNSYVEGKFRTLDNGYSRTEVANILAPMFLRWAQANQLDYRLNEGYEPTDPFSFNYSDTLDRDGARLPGHWRAIYRWYYDTDRPHTAPWEMVGFDDRPTWWVAEYGAAPYTNGNNKLWEHMRDGYIADGPREGYDSRYARPQLLSCIPVDAAGELLDPVAIGIVNSPPAYQSAIRPWTVGDGAPVENLWRNSPSYRFSLTQLAYLLKPARWVENGWDTLNDIRVHDTQWIYRVTGDRPQNAKYSVHGELSEDGVRTVVVGIQQWIADHMISKGQSSSIFGEAVRGLGTQLAHKMAGYTTVDSMRVIADNFGLVPQEDVSVVMYASPSIREEFYSGVLIEWTGKSWTVIGYDALNPNFTVMPGDTAGQKGVVTITDVPEAVIVDWRPNVAYTMNVLVEYDSSVYQVIRPHTSSSKFEQEYWETRPGILRPSAPRVLKYLEPTGEEITVPYGSEFTTLQEVADFIFGYERWLESRGWVFDAMDAETQEVKDWSVAVRDFMQWSQFSWTPGNFITLSPAAERLKFSTDHGMIYSLEQAFNGSYGIVDRSGMPVNRRETFVTRIDGDAVITVDKGDLYGVRLNVGEIEHALMFNNQTIFNDIIFKPLFDLRQPRLRLIGQRTRDWTGRLDAPGYMLIDNQIVPNFDRAAEDLRTMFDIENSENKTLRDHARHLIGYESRPYLDNLLLSDTEQFEFYKGMIHQKGAPSIFNKMLRSQFVDQNRSLKFLEEWAVKIGSYGAVNTRSKVGFELRQSEVKRNPQLVYFGSSALPIDAVQIDYSRFVSEIDSAKFPVRSDFSSCPNSLPSAGYARLNEMDFTAFKTTDLAALYVKEQDKHGREAIPAGSRIWIYDNGLDEWEALRCSDLTTDGTANKIARVEVSPDVYARVYFEKPHGLGLGDLNKSLIIYGATRSDQEIEGVNTIKQFGTNWIDLDINIEEGYRWLASVAGGDDLQLADDPENAPVARILRNARFANDAAFQAATWFNNPTAGELAYIDQTPTTGWKVMRWTGSEWTLHRSQPKKVDADRIVSSLLYETGSILSPKQLIVEPLVLNNLLIFNPVAGLISGEAERELTYKLEYDPAEYSDTGTWASDRVGELWWDISTVRYLEPETDVELSASTARGAAELAYRTTTWGKIAPGSSVDIYEWSRSLVLPEAWHRDGVPYMAEQTPYVEIQEFDPSLDRAVTAYYFWVKNRTVTPFKRSLDRRIDALQVSRLLENPTAFDIPWVAAISEDALLVSGIAQHLQESGSILQLEVRRLDNDGEVHSEWGLMRNGDERSQPTNDLWDRMVDSITGFNVSKQPVPDPNLHPSARHGVSVRPSQSMFGGKGDPRATVLAARESLIGIVNTMLKRANVTQERSDIEELFTAEHKLEPYLLWTTEQGGTASIPALSTYDTVVYTLEERNQLLLDLDFISTKRRVLLNGTAEASPHWSVWEYDPASDDFESDIEGRYTYADRLFTLAPSYDRQVESLTERNELKIDANPLQTNEVVYVENDSTADGFWTLWVYDPTSQSADNEGFVLLRSQEYRLSDFWERADWFADGYSIQNPPVIVYPTFNDRNNAENPTPRSLFVKVNDDGTGSWVWTVYEEGFWKVVARQNGTLSFSDNFYDASRTVYGIEDYDLSTVRNRDGSLELRALMLAIKNGALTAAELNELFFSMVNFAHAHLDQVAWAFKTSFLYIGGYNEELTQAAISQIDNTESLISYVEEVKPYRVKIRDFARVLTAKIDETRLFSTDFDRPIYFDASTQSFRRLGNNAIDLAILSEQEPWKSWYDNYQKTGYDIEAYDPATWNPIRRLTTRIIFDRIDGVLGIPSESAFGTGYDLEPFDADTGMLWDDSRLFSAATKRIEDWYNPDPTMPEKSLETLLKLQFKGTIADGDTLLDPMQPDFIMDGDTAPTLDVLVNPDDEDGRSVLRLNDPIHREDRPEELVVTGNVDNVAVVVHSEGAPGAPIQSVKYFDVSKETDATTTLKFFEVAQSNEGIAVFRDGIRANPSDYLIDHFRRELTVSLTHPDGPRVNSISIHVFGIGSTSKVLERKFFDYVDGDPQTFQVDVDGDVEAIVDGEEVTANLVNGVVTIVDNLSTGDDIQVNVREQGGTGIYIRTETLPYNVTKQWTLSYPSIPAKPYAHAATIVEVDGLRILPPETHYWDSAVEDRFIVLNSDAYTTADIDIWIDGIKYTGSVLTGSFSTISDIFEDTYSDDFVLWENYLALVNPDIQSNDIVVVINSTGEYTVDQNGELEISSSLSAQSDIRVTTFVNNTSMGIQTWVWNGTAQGIYPINAPSTVDYLWVNVNGVRKTGNIEFDQITDGETGLIGVPSLAFGLGFDVVGFDVSGWDSSNALIEAISFAGGHATTDRIVITSFTGKPVALPYSFQVASVMPTKAMMTPITQNGQPVMANTSAGPRVRQTMRDGWEYIRLPQRHVGTLMNDVFADSTTITVGLTSLADDLFSGDSFRLPQPDAPSVAWIDGERIEYADIEKANESVILKNLRRGTKGTRIGNVHVNTVMYEMTGQSSFLLPNATSPLVLVSTVTPEGVSTALQAELQFTTAVTVNGVEVTFVDPPEMGDFITLTQQDGVFSHHTGRSVAASVQKFVPDNKAL